MKISGLIKVLKEKDILLKSSVDIDVNYISFNSNDIEKDTLFICKGMTFKEEYLQDAIDKGTICYISEKDYNKSIPCILVSDISIAQAVTAKWFYSKYDKLKKIGITGTKGKTTILNFIKNIIAEEIKMPAYLSTINYYTGKTTGVSHNTTPEAIDIYKCIKDAYDTDNDYLVMEVSSQAVKMRRVYEMDFDVGIFSNIGKDHVSPLEHKDFEDYFSCKLEFLKMCKKVILYRHIDNYEKIKEILKDKEIITYGLTKDSDYYISDIDCKGDKTSFNVTCNGKTRNFSISMLGSFNVLNAVSAIIVSDNYGINDTSIKKGLLKTKVLGRMNVFNCNGITVIVDYAHNYISGKAFCNAIKQAYPNKNLKLVFGCPGDRGVNRRKEMADISNEYASFVYITMEDPQTKDVLDISKEIASYLTVPHIINTDRKSAIINAINDSNKNDVVAILGKGDENYQIINNEYVFYESDIKVVEDISKKVLEG